MVAKVADGLSNKTFPDMVPRKSGWSHSPDVRFVCQVTYGRYVAHVFSGDEDDVRQRAAAQSILVTSG